MLMLIYCEKCKKEMTEDGEFGRVLFEEICLNYLMHHRGLDFPIFKNRLLLAVVRQLEKDGYVISTETEKNVITVIPKGLQIWHGIRESMCHICFDRQNHK